MHALPGEQQMHNNGGNFMFNNAADNEVRSGPDRVFGYSDWLLVDLLALCGWHLLERSRWDLHCLCG